MGIQGDDYRDPIVRHPLSQGEGLKINQEKNEVNLKNTNKTNIQQKTTNVSIPILKSEQDRVLDHSHGQNNFKLSLKNGEESDTKEVGTRFLGTHMQEMGNEEKTPPEKGIPIDQLQTTPDNLKEEDDWATMLMDSESTFLENATEKQEGVIEKQEGLIKEQKSIGKEKEGINEEAIFTKTIMAIEKEFKEKSKLSINQFENGTFKEVDHDEIAKGNINNLTFFKSETGELLIPSHLKDAIKLKPGDTFQGVKIKKITVLNEEEYRAYVTAYVNYARKEGLLPLLHQTPNVAEEQAMPTSTPDPYLASKRRRSDSRDKIQPQHLASQRPRLNETKATASGTIADRRKQDIKNFNKKMAIFVRKIASYLEYEEKKADNLKRDLHSLHVNEDNLGIEFEKVEKKIHELEAKGIPTKSAIKKEISIMHQEVKLKIQEAGSLQYGEDEIQYLKNLDSTLMRIATYLVNIAGTNTSVGNKEINDQRPAQ